jgi:vacuolar-type H+-ATPase subunit H
MKSTNIGIANLVVSNRLKESYFNNEMIEESKKLTTDFFSVVKSSPILQLEFKVFNSLENKTIENEVVATRYIDNNIKLFEVYTLREIELERGKMNQFLLENVTPHIKDADYDLDRIKLYEAIDTLITELLNDYDKVNVDNIHESFETVLNHIKTPKKHALTESKETEYVDDNIIEIAINKFNEKYDSLNEDDRYLLKRLVKSTDKEKQELLEEYKTECLSILESVRKDSIEEKILKTIQKIKEMKHNSQTVDDDIIGLHDLKRGLL